MPRRPPPPLLAALLPWLLGACAPTPASSLSFPDTVARLPPLDTPERLRVLVMGDQGKGGEMQRRVARAIAALCAQAGCDLGVGLGDNFYPQAPRTADDPAFKERFEDLYGGLKMPFLMVAGNHDESWLWGGDGADPAGLEGELAYARTHSDWIMPDRRYRAGVGELAQFFVVDTAPLASSLPGRDQNFRPGGAFDSAQRAWLGASLAASQARWNIVLGHHPLLNNGKHGSAGSYDLGLLPWASGAAVRRLYREAACGRADLIASGHDHSLQLFPPGPACPGTRLLVSGAAGEVTGPGPGHTPASFQDFAAPGFFWLDLTPEAMIIRAYTLDPAGAPMLAHSETVQRSARR